jgi:hypothetical protein
MPDAKRKMGVPKDDADKVRRKWQDQPLVSTGFAAVCLRRKRGGDVFPKTK